MGLEHFGKVHPVKLVTGQDQHVIKAILIEVAKIFANRIGGPFVPGLSFHGLLSGQDFHESAVELIKAVRLANMCMQTDRVELGQ